MLVNEVEGLNHAWAARDTHGGLGRMGEQNGHTGERFGGTGDVGHEERLCTFPGGWY